jgi:SAM-dependent methyltransferase
MHLRRLQRHWHEFGRRDAFWAVLTHPEKADGGWEQEEFYATGRQDVAETRAWLGTLGQPTHWRHALDFGCGAGRLTRALAAHADAVTGVDIAASMLDAARRHTPEAHCRYLHNTGSDLHVFDAGAFDLVYSRLVLQHMPPRYIRAYLAEFMRVLGRGGTAVFQVPGLLDEPPVARVGVKTYAPMPLIVAVRRVRRWWRHRPAFPYMESWGLDRGEVEAIVTRAGGRVVAVRPCDSNERSGWEYAVTR